MAVSLRCPSCQATLGKDVENLADAHCGECGHSFFNPRGQVLDKEHLQEVKKKYPEEYYGHVSKMYE